MGSESSTTTNCAYSTILAGALSTELLKAAELAESEHWYYHYRMYIGTQEEAVHTLHPATHRTRLPKEERGPTLHWMRGFYGKLFGVNVIDYSIVGKEHCISRGHQNASTELCRECLFACSAVEWRLTVHVHVQYMCKCLNYREVCQSRDMG